MSHKNCIYLMYIFCKLCQTFQYMWGRLVLTGSCQDNFYFFAGKIFFGLPLNAFGLVRSNINAGTVQCFSWWDKLMV